MPGEDHAVRICNRVADQLLADPDPTSVVDTCSRCDTAVYVTMGQELPELPGGITELETVCTRCFVADPEMCAGADPMILRLARRQHAIADIIRN